jgi:hypothetical protein
MPQPSPAPAPAPPLVNSVLAGPTVFLFKFPNPQPPIINFYKINCYYNTIISKYVDYNDMTLSTTGDYDYWFTGLTSSTAYSIAVYPCYDLKASKINDPASATYGAGWSPSGSSKSTLEVHRAWAVKDTGGKTIYAKYSAGSGITHTGTANGPIISSSNFGVTTYLPLYYDVGSITNFAVETQLTMTAPVTPATNDNKFPKNKFFIMNTTSVTQTGQTAVPVNSIYYCQTAGAGAFSNAGSSADFWIVGGPANAQTHLYFYLYNGNTGTPVIPANGLTNFVLHDSHPSSINTATTGGPGMFTDPQYTPALPAGGGLYKSLTYKGEISKKTRNKRERSAFKKTRKHK